MLVSLRGDCDEVAFNSEPDSMISPSDGVDRDLDLRFDAIAIDLMGSCYQLTIGNRIYRRKCFVFFFFFFLRPLEEASEKIAQLA